MPFSSRGSPHDHPLRSGFAESNQPIRFTETADVARNDRDQIMTQTYLTSDTGKVYTMLAHASGKLR